MEANPYTDPFTFWRDVYNRTEQAWTDFVQKSISSPAYAESLGTNSQALLNNLETWRTFTERYLTEIWNIPTRNDLGRLGEVVVAIDAKADDLDDRADGLEQSLARVEKALSTLNTRVATLAQNGPVAVQERSAQLETRITGLEKRLDALTGQTEKIVALLEKLPQPAKSEDNGSRARGSRNNG